MLLKLNIRYGHELINWDMSVYFVNIGLVQKHIEKLVAAYEELNTRVPWDETGVFALFQNACVSTSHGLVFHAEATHL